MKASLTLMCTVALLCLILVVPAGFSAVPQTLNVQGKLTDPGGTPVADGSYSVVFSIYDVSSGGTALWQETRTVNTVDGLFSIILGQSVAVPSSLFDNTDLWLGMKVEADPEMTPRQQLTTAPYSFRTSDHSHDATYVNEGQANSINSGMIENSSIQFNDIGQNGATAGQIMKWDGGGWVAANDSVGTGGGGGGWADDGNVVRLETSSDSVGIGTAVPQAKLHVVADPGGSGVKGVSAASGGLSQHAGVAAINTASGPGLYASSSGWHAILGINSDPNAAVIGRNDGSGPGVRGQNQGTGPAFAGYASSGNLLELYNIPGPNLRFSVNNAGDVQASGTIESTSGGFKFPDGTVQTTAAKDEPGIAQGILKGNKVEVTGQSSMIDIVTVTVSIPAPGYIVLEASGQARLNGTTSSNNMLCQIDKTAGGSYDNNYYYIVGFATPPNTNLIWLPISMRRTYYESSAGSYTYRLEAMDNSGNGNKNIWNPVITATYLPTSYGTVAVKVSSSEAGLFESAELTAPGTNGLEEAPTREASYLVDLRELELKAARIKAELEKVQREIDEAEVREQETPLKEQIER